MPRYDYTCPNCGTFEAYGHFEESEKLCPTCEKSMAARESVYTSQQVGVGVGQVEGEVVMPPKDDAHLGEMQDELAGNMRKIGWDKDRAITEMRKNRETDEKGNMRIRTDRMTKAADTRALRKK